MRAFLVPLVVGAGATFAIACSDAPSTVQGGISLFDAGVAPVSSVPTINPNLSADCTSGGMHTGSTWTDLYSCYFGTTGIIGCAGAPNTCHATSDSAGAFQWVCGTTQASCRQGLITGMLAKGTGMYTDALLYSQVCQLDSTGTLTGSMPLGCLANPMQQLVPSDMARIQAWLVAGAPDN